MDVNRIFSAEQIAVPPDLPLILKEWTKAVFREHPSGLLEFSLEWFKAGEKAIQAEIIKNKQLSLLCEAFEARTASVKMQKKDFKAFILDDLGLKIPENELEEVLLDFDTGNKGFLELDEIVDWVTHRREHGVF